MGLFSTIGKKPRAAERPPSGIGQQLGTTKAAAFLKATIGNNNYGREAAAFLNWATGIKNGSLLLGTGNKHGREAAAFLSWATIGNNNYDREAAAFLNSSNCYK
jgi:hypothetical protein